MAVRSPFPDVRVPDNIDLTTYIVEKAVACWPNRKALIDSRNGTSLTFIQLKTAITNIGNALKARGLVEGDVFCFVTPNLVETAVAMLAVPLVGGIVTAINPISTPGEINYQAIDSNSVYVMTTPDCIAKVQSLQSSVKEIFTTSHLEGYTSYYDLLNEGATSPIPPRIIKAKQMVALIPYTSGTTGLPKGAMVSHYCVLAHVNIFGPQQDNSLFQPGADVCYSVFPFYHFVGIVLALYLGVFSGVTLVCGGAFNFEQCLEIVQRFKVTMLPIPPSVLLRMVKDHVTDRCDLSSVHTMLTAGAPVDASLIQATYDMCRPSLKQLSQLYGMTELGVAYLTKKDDHVYGSTGNVTPNVITKIVDTENGKTLGPNQSGELWVKNDYMMMGYLNKVSATKALIDAQGWLHTGDVGYHDTEGRLFIVDRLKDLIKYKAMQVSPAELEAVLLTHPTVADVAVVGVPDEVGGEVPRAFVVLKPGHDATRNEISKYVADKVAPYKKLRGGVVFTNVIPKSPSGKILRRLLVNKQNNIQHNKSKL